MMERLAPRVRLLGWTSLVANATLVVTGGVVRLTGSGLGCPTWPKCTDDSYTPHGELTLHAAIEFGNRMLTYVLIAVAVLTWLAARTTGRRDLKVVTTILALGVPAQAVIGGITVLTDLNPWVVSFHLLLSLAMVGLSVRFLHLLDGPSPTSRGPVTVLAWLMFAAGWAVLYIGTIVTGSGPHAGDADVERNGIDPVQISQLHADSVFLFIGVTIGLLCAVLALRGKGVASRAVTVLLVVQLSQGTIGFVQYFTNLPVVLVGFHLLGSAVTSAAMTWAALQVWQPTSAAVTGSTPPRAPVATPARTRPAARPPG